MKEAGRSRLVTLLFVLLVLPVAAFGQDIFIEEGFDDFVAPDWTIPAGWEFHGIGTGDIFTDAGSYGAAAPALKMGDEARVLTSSFSSAADVQLSFWVRGIAPNDSSALVVEEYYGTGWSTVVELYSLPTEEYGMVMGPYGVGDTTTRVRFTYVQAEDEGELAFDDVVIQQATTTTTTTTTTSTTTTTTTVTTTTATTTTTTTTTTTDPTTTTTTTTTTTEPTTTTCLPADGFPEGFDDFVAPDWTVPDGWTFEGIESGDVFTETNYYGVDSPALKFADEDDRVVSRSFTRPETLSFWVRGVGTDPSTLLVVEEYYGGFSWQTVTELADPPAAGTVMTYPLEQSSTRVRFTYARGPGEIAFDDVGICRLPVTPTPPPVTPVPTPPPAPTPVPDDTLVFYPFTGDSPAPVDTAACVDAGDFQISAGTLSYGTANAATWIGSGVPYALGTGGWTEQDDWRDGKKFYFTVEPVGGDRLLIDEIEFLYRVPSTAGPGRITVAAGGVEIETIDPVTYGQTLQFSADDLGLIVLEEIEIAIVGWATEGTGGGTFQIDDVTLRGACLPAATPTPSPSPTLTPTPTPFGYKTPTPTVTPSATPTPSPLPTPERLTWYLPAGGTFINDYVFDQYVLISNPTDDPAPVKVTFVEAGGEIDSFAHIVAPNSRYTVKVNDRVGNNRPAVSTIVVSTEDVPIKCERASYWSPGGVKWAGGHNSAGIRDAATLWYLSEGATHIFEQFVHILNPSATLAADIQVLFVTDEGARQPLGFSIAPRSTLTLDVRDLIGLEDQVSTLIRSLNNAPIAVERTMYWNSDNIDWVDGHSSRGASEAAEVWHIAEGATHLFNYYVVVTNPHPTDFADVRFTFRGSGISPVTRTIPVGPARRRTVKVNEVAGSLSEVWTTVESLNRKPVIAERAMYWDAGGIKWAGGHGSIASSQTALRWHLPEGATHVFDEYVMAANPSADQPAEVKFIFTNESGDSWEITRTIPPGGRRTVNVKQVTGAQGQVSTRVESLNGVPIVAERSMYWSPGGVHWGAGHSSVGIRE